MSHFSQRVINATSIFFLCMLWIAAPAISLAQTILKPGDIVLTTIKADNKNYFSFVPLVDLSPHTIIKFTDNAWDDSSNMLQNNEGVITFTTANAIPAGTVISYDGSDNNRFTETDSSFNISRNGDNILVYTGEERSPAFIYGAGFGQNISRIWSYNGGEHTSDIPSPLSESNDTILSLSLGTDNNVHYDTSNGTDGIAKSLRTLVGDERNWNGNDTFDQKQEIAFHIQKETGDINNNSETNTLTIHDIENPPVVINEILADPPDGLNGDANGDGIRSDADDEFIELVNTRSHNIDISGWQLSNDGGENIQYIFPSGTVLSADQSIVVFGGGHPIGGFGGAIIQASNGLSLNNKQGKVALLDNSKILIQSVLYGKSDQPDGNNNESITRNPDITGIFEGHTNTDTKSLFSPGTKINGMAFGSTYAVSLRGTEGWRFIASPTEGTTFNDLFNDIRTQGISGSDAPSADANIYSWDESAGGLFKVVGSMNDPLSAGKGYIIYIYKDDDFNAPGIQGRFPKVIKTNNSKNASSVDLSVSSTDENDDGTINGNEGYNLLGNPFGISISVDAVIDALGDVNPNVNKKVYIWDNSKGKQGDYRVLSQGNAETIAPFQAFFIRYTTALSKGQTVTFDRSNLAVNKGTAFYTETAGPKTEFKLTLSDGQQLNSYKLKFSEDGKVGEDLYDGYKLSPLNKNTIQLFSTVGDGIRLAQNELPPVKSIDDELRIPLGYQVPASGEYTISWVDFDAIPEGFKLYLIDNKTGRKFDMQTSDKFTFHAISESNDQIKRKKTHPRVPELQSQNGSKNSRFELLLINSSSQQKPREFLNEPVTLSPNYPNPFSSQTTMELQLKKKMHVKMTIWNIVGQKIATIIDKMMDPGAPHPMRWNVPGNLPSGIYICKVEAGGKVLTRKMTLVK